MAARGMRKRSGAIAIVPTRFSSAEVARIDRVQSLLGLRSRSEFIREAVLEKVLAVEAMKIVEVRDVSATEAVRLIDQYLQKHPGVHYTSDIADELGLELGVAFAAAEDLIDKGRARVRGD